MPETSPQLYKPADEPNGVRVPDLVERYLLCGMKSRNPVAITEIVRVLRLFASAFGDRLLRGVDEPPVPKDRRLSPVDFILWLKSQRGPKADNTKRRWLKTVVACLNWATEFDEIDRNPLARVHWPKGPTGRSLKLPELLGLLRACPPLFRRVLLFLRTSGLRPDEFCSLEWSMYDERLGLFELREHKTARSTGKPRSIVLPDTARKLLAWIKRHRPDPRWVFVNHFGKKWNPGGLQKRLRKLRTKLGLPGDAKLYGARHAYITCGLVNGNDLKTASVLAGHSSVQTTGATYAHLEGEIAHLRDGANRAARLLPKVR